MRRPVYRWRVAPPLYYPSNGNDIGPRPVEVVGANRYEAIIAAAKIWRVPWTAVARASTFEKLGEVAEV